VKDECGLFLNKELEELVESYNKNGHIHLNKMMHINAIDLRLDRMINKIDNAMQEHNVVS